MIILFWQTNSLQNTIKEAISGHFLLASEKSDQHSAYSGPDYAQPDSRPAKDTNGSTYLVGFQITLRPFCEALLPNASPRHRSR